MMGLSTAMDRRLKSALPARSNWIEAAGFLLVGAGLFLALACYSFSPFDYTSSGIDVQHVRNLAGPAGAAVAAQILGRFGVVGMFWPVIVAAWGVLVATGFVTVPKPRRLVGFVALTTDVAGFAELLLPKTALPEPSFGFGGQLGFYVKKALVSQMGSGGTLIALAVLGIIALVLTDNLKISQTAAYLQDFWCFARKTSRKVWVRFILNQEAPVPAGKAMTAPLDAARAAKRRPVAEVGAASPAAAPSEATGGIEFHYEGPTHGKPEASLFSRTKAGATPAKDFSAIGTNLVQQLAEFKIMGEMKDVTQGPVVTTFEFKPAPGTKVSKIAALSEDLARMLSAQSLRVLAPIPGKDTVGFEVPNDERSTIGLGELVDSKEFRATKRRLPIAMGVDIFGRPVIEDLAEMPHLLVAGSTGSGKSVFMNTLVASLIARHTASTLRLIMIDPKMVEMAAYNALPHLATPVITDPQGEARAALGALVTEMDDRYRKMRAVGARNIESFNDVVRSRRKSEFMEYDGRWVPMPYVVLIVDEMADMMMTLGKEIETPLTRLAQKARACGIHMVVATQRPSADVVTGLIKANFPTRVAFRVLSGIDSRTILDQSGAETLLGKGDMLYMAAGGVNRLHGAYLSEAEVQSMVKATAKGKK